MKTLKINDYLHHDLLKLKANLNLPTLSETIRFLYDYTKNLMIENKEGHKNGNK